MRSCTYYVSPGAGGEVNLHWFAVAGFLENFGRHVAWRPAGGGKDMKSLFIHNP